MDGYNVVFLKQRVNVSVETYIVIVWQGIARLELNNLVFVARSPNVIDALQIKLFLDANISNNIDLQQTNTWLCYIANRKGLSASWITDEDLQRKGVSRIQCPGPYTYPVLDSGCCLDALHRGLAFLSLGNLMDSR